MKRRANGKGNAVYTGSNREYPWLARITIGQDEFGGQIRHYLGRFKTELEALIYLEEYHKKPTPIYIKQAKFDKIYLPANFDYPLIPVKNPKIEQYKNKSKNRYTFAEVYNDFKKQKLLTETEMQEYKYKNKKVKGKLSYNYCILLTTAYKHTVPLWDIPYKDISAKDFQKIIDNKNKTNRGGGVGDTLVKLFRNLDKFALQEGIIDKGYAQYINNNTAKIKKVNKTIFTPEEIKEIENIQPDIAQEQIVKDILIIALYTGCRANEILYLKNENIFLDKGYMVGGSKTEAGINREIPIHHKIKSIIEKYHNNYNEFLFTWHGKVCTYRSFYAHNFIRFRKKYGLKHTIHECRHTFRTALEQLNIKQVVINSILGHKNGDIGLDVYTHITLEEKKYAVNLVDYNRANKIVVLKSG